MQVNVYNDILYPSNEIVDKTINLNGGVVTYSGNVDSFKLNDLEIQYPENIYNIKNNGIYVYNLNGKDIFRYDINKNTRIVNELDGYYQLKDLFKTHV